MLAEIERHLCATDPDFAHRFTSGTPSEACPAAGRVGAGPGVGTPSLRTPVPPSAKCWRSTTRRSMPSPGRRRSWAAPGGSPGGRRALSGSVGVRISTITGLGRSPRTPRQQLEGLSGREITGRERAGCQRAARMVASGNGHSLRRSYPQSVALRCLIVDDNPGFLRAARALLEQEGIRIVGVATSGAEAVRRAAELHPDVTLLDIDLGEESGFDVARQLFDDGGIDPGYLILVSAYTEDEFFDLIEASPAIGFVRKPALSSTAIVDLVRVAIDGRRAGTAES